MKTQPHSYSKPKVPVILQRKKNDCALACMSMITAYFSVAPHNGGNERQGHFNKTGMTIGELISLANTLGLSTNTHRPEWTVLHNVSVPCILHWRGNHFIVLIKTSPKGLTIHDPAHGKLAVTWRVARKLYSGACIEFSRTGRSVWPVKSDNYASPAFGITSKHHVYSQTH